MAVRDRLRRAGSELTSSGDEKRYGEQGDFDADEVLDPEEFRDPKSLSWTERLYRARRHLISGGFLLFAALLVAAGYSRILIPELYGNPVVREISKWAIAVPLVFAIGMRVQRKQIFGLHKQTFKLEDGTIAMYGKIVKTPNGERAFVPIRGFDLYGLRRNEMTLADLGRRFPHLLSKQAREADSPARIRLTDGLYSESDTWIGREGVVHTSGLKMDPFGKHTDVYAAPPNTVDHEEFRGLTEEVEKVHDRNEFLEDRVDEIKTDRDELQTELREKRGKIRQELKETMQIARDIQQPRRSRNRRTEDSRSSGPTLPEGDDE